MIPRAVHPTEIDATAQLWHDAWHETQAPHVPDALIANRAFDSFKIRLVQMGDLLRVAGPVGTPIAMCSIRPGELHQLFVAPKGRGSGIAAAMLADAEARLLAQGDRTAKLDCLKENRQAIAFYTRQGWVEDGVEIAHLDTLDGPFDLPCLVFRKELTPNGAS